MVHLKAARFLGRVSSQAKVAVQTDAKRRMHEVQGTICSKAWGGARDPAKGGLINAF